MGESTCPVIREYFKYLLFYSNFLKINSSNDSDYRIPFGGVKQSGIGRELGEAGLAAYTNAKAVHVNMGSRL